ncbi:MAG: hypothetical protein J7L95_03295, partial [Prolixibacteraceae bacterium]|nr:hypothetical protein [Prolixibacteraceae bacterium]
LRTLLRDISVNGYDMTQLIPLPLQPMQWPILPATANRDTAGQNESKTIRDKAYTHMQEPAMT